VFNLWEFSEDYTGGDTLELSHYAGNRVSWGKRNKEMHMVWCNLHSIYVNVVVISDLLE